MLTGRTLAPKSEGVGGSLQETAEEVRCYNFIIINLAK